MPSRAPSPCGHLRLTARALARLLLAASVGTANAAPDDAPTGTLAFEPYGFAVYPIPSRAAEASVFLSPDDAVSLSLARGDHTRLLATYRSELLLARYRRLLAGGSHVNGGFGYRTLRQSYDTRLSDGTEATVATSLELLVVEASLGNRIHFGPVVLGCDWVGLVVPVAKLAAQSTSPEGVDATEKEDNEDAFDRIAFAPTLQLLRVSVGMAL